MTPPVAMWNRSPLWSLVVSAALAIVAAALRTSQSRESLWADELHTAWCASGTLAEVAQRAAIGNQSPLFFWLEWALSRLLGESELVLRLPSLAAGSLVPVAMFWLAWRWTTSSGVGLVVAALVVVDPLAIFFATEARPYALVQLLAVVHVGLFAEMAARPTAWLRIAFVAGAMLLFYLHYTAALLILAELAWWGLMGWTQPAATRYRWTQLLADLGLTAALCLPALGNLQGIFARREHWAAFVPRRPIWEVFDLLPWSASALFVLAAIVIDAARGRPNDEPRTAFRLLALCWLLVPVGLAWLTTATDVARLFFPRYLAASAPAAMLLAALCIDLAPGRWAKFTVGAGIVVAAIWTSGIAEQLSANGRVIDSREEDWRGAVAWLNEQLPEQPYLVLVASGLIEADALGQPHDPLLEDYCLLPVNSLYRLRADPVDLIPLTYRDAGKLFLETQERIRTRNGAWLIVRGTAERAEHVAGRAIADLERKESVIGGDDWKTIKQQSFGRVQVLLIRPSNSDPHPRLLTPAR
jgi:hypothetical protein